MQLCISLCLSPSCLPACLSACRPKRGRTEFGWLQMGRDLVRSVGRSRSSRAIDGTNHERCGAKRSEIARFRLSMSNLGRRFEQGRLLRIALKSVTKLSHMQRARRARQPSGKVTTYKKSSTSLRRALSSRRISFSLLTSIEDLNGLLQGQK